MTSTVYIAKNVYGGDGLGRLGDGRVVFVPGAWAGENVKAEIVEERRRFVKARLVEVVEASPERVDPGELGRIPGCVYAGLSARGEADAKESQLRDFLERARIPFPGVRAAGPAGALNYRNKVVYHFARTGEGWKIGYRTSDGRDVVDMPSDPLAVRQINEKLPEVRRSVLSLLTQGAESVRRDVAQKGSVTIRWTASNGVKWWVGEPPSSLSLRERTCGRDFEVPAGGFYQVNPAVGDALVKAVVDEYLGGDAADMVDLYCGVGVFGLCCMGARGARAGEDQPRLTGIESGRQSVEFAKRNAEAQRVTAHFFADTAARSMRKLRIGPRTTVVVDPPRGGMEPGVARALAASPAARILCVSCDPATLTRDLRELSAGYDVESVRWFDMFPRTARFETLVALKKKGGAAG